LVSAGSFAASVRARLARIGPVDRAIAHWILPCAWPLLSDTRSPIDVVAHGADVRLLLRAPRPFREHVFRGLLGRGARFTFAAGVLQRSLEQALPASLAESLSRSSHVEPPPIDVPDASCEREARRRSIDLAPGERLAVTACRLIPSKRVELAIEAARTAAPRLRLVIVGDGPERTRLEARAITLGITPHFLGALPRRDALAWIAAADVLLHPSAVEAAPTVIREARALGSPVVACATGDVEVWAKSDPGIVVAEGNAASLAKAVELALEGPRATSGSLAF
jgi:teichuronic acid biosynthesis glycosyltransferase TuaC